MHLEGTNERAFSRGRSRHNKVLLRDLLQVLQDQQTKSHSPRLSVIDAAAHDAGLGGRRLSLLLELALYRLTCHLPVRAVPGSRRARRLQVQWQQPPRSKADAENK